MINADVNLLPDSIIESLQQNKVDKERWYFLFAIIATLIACTGLALGVLFLTNRSIAGSEQLLNDQLVRVELLNDFWSEIIILSQSSEFVMPIQSELDEMQITWEGVHANLQGVGLVSFARMEPSLYRIEVRAATPQESIRFLQDLRGSLPANIELDTIQQDEDSVFFSYTIEY